MNGIPSLIEVVRLLATGVGAGAIVAFLMEKSSWFQKLSSQTRWWVILAICMVLPVLATVALQFVPAAMWETLTPYWNALAAGFMVWLGSQAAHKILKKDKEEELHVDALPLGFKTGEPRRSIEESLRRGPQR